jgi:hypothetical protein
MEQVFHKNGQTAWAYKPAQAIRLRSEGWVEETHPSRPDKPKAEKPEKKDDDDKEGALD